MNTHRFVTVTMATAMVTASLVLIGDALSAVALAEAEQTVKTPPGGVLAEPPGNAGGPIYATFEGWGPLKDGSNALLLGYFNRNKVQTVDILGWIDRVDDHRCIDVGGQRQLHQDAVGLVARVELADER